MVFNDCLMSMFFICADYRKEKQRNSSAFAEEFLCFS